MTKNDFVLAVLAASDGGIHTPVQVQKLFFLLDKKIPQHVGGPYFHFRPDDYGPFDRDVYDTLETLSGSGYVTIDRVPDLRRKTYRPTPNGQSTGSSKLSELRPDVCDYIRKLSAWVRSLSFAQLVSAVYAEYPDMKANSIFKH